MTNKQFNILNMFDLGYLISKDLIKEDIFSPLIDLSLGENKIHIYLYNDLVLNIVDIDLESRWILMKSPSTNLLDTIHEFYSLRRYKQARKLLSQGKKWGEILLIFPELYKEYSNLQEITAQLERKYGKPFRLKIDKDGEQYLELKINLEEFDYRKIRKAVLLGLEIFKEYAKTSNSARLPLIGNIDRATYQSELTNLLEITKKILMKLTSIKRQPYLVMLSNYNKRPIDILIETKKELKDGLTITRKKDQYIVEITRVKDDGHEIHSEKMKNKHDLMRWIEDELPRILQPST